MERRNFLKNLCAVSALTTVATSSLLIAEEAKKTPKGKNAISYEAALAAITGGKPVADSNKISLTVPEIAENGAVVPVKVSVDHPMEANNYVKAIHILVSKNGNTRAVDVMLTPLNAKAYFATRVKLGGTQDVVAVVELSNGTFIKSSKSVKVTIGGCG
ncbi:MAG: thiosulfate oxidation carrier protein SoxY [Sulfurovum sp.]|nr:thiosulfate oxidation carrier protein SoxY [Sulfurovum sp.]MCB4766280.1 thiosulfate oxidation carrier protein SoxY [Sulfurovum sp.]